MKLARRLVFGILLGIIAVLALTAWLRVARQVELFDRDMARDDLLVGRTIAASVARIWAAEGEEAALAFARAFHEQDTDVQVRWVWLDAAPGTPDAPRLPASTLADLRAGAAITRREDAHGALYTYVPVAVPTPGRRVGALELSESLDAERLYVRRSVSNVAVTTAALLVVSALLTSILGALFVGRPVHLLVGKVRRIASGDLGGALELRRDDELRELASAINQMCEALAAANESARRETAARIAAVEQLRHADRLTTVGKLASGIAHELGTPLNIVSGRGQMIASREVTGDEVVENAVIIVEQAERMTQIIRQLLTFARPRSAEKAHTSLRTLATDTVALLRPMAEKKGVDLAVAEDDTPSELTVDAGQIQQALMNLIVNALHATARGGTVTVGCDGRVPATTPDGRAVGRDYLRLFVRDDGCGMDPDTQARIFDPFFTTKEVGEGTGLGLSIAYGIVGDHGGWIDVESAVGRGTTVSLYLPRDGAREVRS